MPDLSEWTRWIVAEVKKRTPMPGGGIAIDQTPNGFVIRNIQSGGGGAGGSDTPFTVVKMSDYSVKITGNTTNGYKNYIALGNLWLEFTEQIVGGIYVTGWLYLEITYAGGSVVYNLIAKYSNGETPPSKTNFNDIILIRRIVCSGGVIASINSPVQIADMGGKIY